MPSSSSSSATLSSGTHSPSIIRDVTWAGIVVPFTLLIIAYFASPHNQTWFVTEKTYTQYLFPVAKPETVPSSHLVAFILTCAALLPFVDITCVKNIPKKVKIINGLNAGLGLLETFLFTVAFTEFGKRWVTEPRPDFVARCIGSVDDTPTFDPSTGNIICTQNITTDAFLSFPSGHSSTAFSAGVYLTFYFAWLGYLRKVDTFWRAESGQWVGRFGSMLGEFLYVLVLWPLIVAMWVAASRVVDHRHSPADVVAGALLGTLVAVFVFPRVMARTAGLDQNSALKGKYANLSHHVSRKNSNAEELAEPLD